MNPIFVYAEKLAYKDQFLSLIINLSIKILFDFPSYFRLGQAKAGFRRTSVSSFFSGGGQALVDSLTDYYDIQDIPVLGSA